MALLVAALVAVALASSVTFETQARLNIPAGWQKVAPASEETPISFTVFLKNANIDRLEDEVLRVSDPSSDSYGKYWTRDEVVSFFKPKKEATATVMTWLLQHGLKFKVACHDDCIIVEGNAGSVERMLGVQLHQFVHSQTQSSVIRSLTHYNIPATVAPHVTVLSGLLRFPRLEKSPHVKRLGEPGVSVTPQSIRKYYNITVPATSPKNLQAVVSFLGQYFDPADLAYFQKSLDLPQKPISKIIGPNDASNPGTEASLDVDYLTGIPGSIETWVWSTAGERPAGDEPFLTWLVDLASNKSPLLPHVYSMSYQDYEYTVTPSYASQVSDMFGKLNLIGYTFVTGSGDWGVGCMDATHCNAFTSDFPSSSPYVTSVGGTYITESAEERAVGFSSGGFSNYFAQPKYQRTAVSEFLAQPNKPSVHLYNVTGRAFPDVSTVSTNFQVVQSGGFEPVAGTSAATPTFAAMLSMINDLRIAKNLPVLGNVNPLLYKAWESNRNIFKDITSGDEQASGCCGSSFKPVAGWDPYTGMGTPRFDQLAKALLNFK